MQNYDQMITEYEQYARAQAAWQATQPLPERSTGSKLGHGLATVTGWTITVPSVLLLAVYGLTWPIVAAMTLTGRWDTSRLMDWTVATVVFAVLSAFGAWLVRVGRGGRS